MLNLVSKEQKKILKVHRNERERQFFGVHEAHLIFQDDQFGAEIF
jgi:hypothetical protein